VEESQKVLSVVQHKNMTAENIMKSIEKNFKISNSSSQSSAIGKPLQTIAKPSKKPINQQSQNVKTGDQNQNQKPMSKKQFKKEVITATYTTNSVLSSMIINKANNPPPTKSTTNCTDVDKKNTALHKQKIGEKDKFFMAQNCDVSAVDQK
jgi:hypothetical protein